jgi:hypothetical protein
MVFQALMWFSDAALPVSNSWEIQNETLPEFLFSCRCPGWHVRLVVGKKEFDHQGTKRTHPSRSRKYVALPGASILLESATWKFIRNSARQLIFLKNEMVRVHECALLRTALLIHFLS